MVGLPELVPSQVTAIPVRAVASSGLPAPALHLIHIRMGHLETWWYHTAALASLGLPKQNLSEQLAHHLAQAKSS